MIRNAGQATIRYPGVVHETAEAMGGVLLFLFTSQEAVAGPCSMQ